ncbi:peptidase T [Brochothrix thermosphacta]|uniref:peptidase T n=1 Tax=Brochothrix thermosphacta TaxID=2756 RepID=UPI00083F8F6E|nr:peptidase T [Brochothrix thermosphacta]ODJ49967.1 peptidase T [Brochothrix thermosphacta]
MMEKITERLITYAKIDTQSDENSTTTPSTPGQWDLLHHLGKEMKEVGLTDVHLDENGYLMGTVRGDLDVATIGFLAHVDTATDFTGKDVKPQIHENYDGKDIVLNKEHNIVMRTADFPELSDYKGQTLITTDGTTLLGADDKAGIAEIMTAMEYLIAHPEIKHGDIRIAFTPDEEIGRGPEKFDVERFNADFAYTMDGGPVGELEYESFNAAGAVITFQGNSVHPGTAKGKMVNAGALFAEFHALLPADEVPEKTEGKEGFFHLSNMSGSVESAKASYIIRDFDREAFEERKRVLTAAVKQMQAKYGEKVITIEMADQYYNMREKIEPVIEIVALAQKAYDKLGITPHIIPIRGGTDGSQLSYMGLPTPNVFAGGENMHGKFEYVAEESMIQAMKVIIEIVKEHAN